MLGLAAVNRPLSYKEQGLHNTTSIPEVQRQGLWKYSGLRAVDPWPPTCGTREHLVTPAHVFCDGTRRFLRRGYLQLKLRKIWVYIGNSTKTALL